MNPHTWTAIAYVVIGGILLLESALLLRYTPEKTVKDFLVWISRFPVRETVFVSVANLWLFGLFIFACALDHFTLGGVELIADFEGVVSVFTAAVVAAEWVYLKWLR